MSDYITSAPLAQWQKAKTESQKLARVLRAAGDRRWVSVMQCSDVVTLKYCPDCGRLHIMPSWACRHRLCPTCQIRRARAIGGQALAAYEYMLQGGALEGARLYLITLTQRNVSAARLRAEVDDLLGALSAMRQVRAVRRHLIGSARNIEITYNRVEDTFHPHVHMVAILGANAPQEMSTERFWRDLWRTLKGLNYDPICDIRPIDDSAGAVCEVSKYVAKSGEMLRQLDESRLVPVVQAINDAISGRRLTSYTGIWREARKVLQQADEPDPAAVQDDERDTVCGCGASLLTAMLRWSGCEYRPILPGRG